MLPWLEEGVLDKAHSYVIGDRATDELADNMGITGLRYDRETLDWPTICEQLTRRDRYAHVERITKETGGCESVAGPRRRQQDPYRRRLLTICSTKSPPTAASAWRLTSAAICTSTITTVEDTGGPRRSPEAGAWRQARHPLRLRAADGRVSRPLRAGYLRPAARYKADFTYQRVGDLSTEMVEHFFRSLSYTMAVTLHLKTKGKNDHHRVESLFKAFGRTLRRIRVGAMPCRLQRVL